VIAAPWRIREAITVILSNGSMPVMTYDDCSDFVREAALAMSEVALIFCIDPFATGALDLLRDLKEQRSHQVRDLSPTLPFSIWAEGISGSFRQEILSLGGIVVEGGREDRFSNARLNSSHLAQLWSSTQSDAWKN